MQTYHAHTLTHVYKILVSAMYVYKIIEIYLILLCFYNYPEMEILLRSNLAMEWP